MLARDEKALEELKPRFGVQRVVLAGDWGLVFQATLDALERQRLDFNWFGRLAALCPSRRFSTSQVVLSRAGRYQHGGRQPSGEGV